MNHRVAMILLIVLGLIPVLTPPASAQGDVGATPDTAVPFGESASVGLYTVTVTDYETDASAAMEVEADPNRQWVAVTMSVTNDTDAPIDGLFLYVGITGSRGQLTTSYWNSCSNAPEFEALPPGASRSVTSCLSVNSKDIDNAVLWIQNSAIEDGEPAYDTSATWFEVSADSGYDPSVAAAQRGAALAEDATDASSFDEPAGIAESIVGAGFRVDILEYLPVDPATLPDDSQARYRVDAGYELAYLLLEATNISDSVLNLTASAMGPSGIGYVPVAAPEPGDTDGAGLYLPGGTAVTERLVVLDPDDVGSEVIVLVGSTALADRGEHDQQFAYVLPEDSAFEAWPVPNVASPIAAPEAEPIEAAPGDTVALGGWEITAEADTSTADSVIWSISLTNTTLEVMSNRLQPYSVDAASAELYCGFSLDLDPDPWLIAPGSTGVYDRGCSTEAEVLELRDFGSPEGTDATFSSDNESGTGDEPAGEDADATEEAADPVAGGATATVTAATANLRSEPSTSAAIAAVLTAGDTLTITGEPVDAEGYTWYPVTTADGVDGWIASQLIAFEE